MTRTSTLIVRDEPEPLDLAFLQHAQHLGLRLRRSCRRLRRGRSCPRSAISNLPICFSVAPVNAPRSWPNSSDSISSSGIAAQLTWTNRSLRAQAAAMDRPRDQFLADAALAEDQHGRVGRRRAPDLLDDLLQRRAVADELMPRLERRPQLPVLAPQRAELEPFAHGVEHVVLRQRLLDEAERAEPAGFERRRRRAVRRDHHDRQRVVRRRAAGSALRGRRGPAS